MQYRRLLLPLMASILSWCTLTRGKQFKLGLLVPMDTSSKESQSLHGMGLNYEGKNYASAIVVALNQIKNDSLLPGHNISFVLEDTFCDEEVTLRALTRLICKQNVSAVIGPGCFCVTSARLAASFNVPMISYMCSSPEVSKEAELYRTFARTNSVHSQVAPSIIALLKHFGWKRAGIVCEKSSPWYPDTCEFLKKAMEEQELDPVSIETAVPPVQEVALRSVQEPFKNETDRIFQEIKAKARIVILAMSFGTARYFMLRTLKANMTGKEGYAYIFLGTDETEMNEMRHHGFMWLNGVVQELHSKTCDIWKAFESMLVLTSKPPSPSPQIVNDTKELIKEPPFNSTVFIKWPKRQLPFYGYHLYDAVYQYAIALNETLAKNEEPNGTTIINQLKGRQYKSILGYKMRFDKNADSYFNMTLWDMEPMNHVCNENGVNSPNTSTAGNFDIGENESDTDGLKFVRTQHTIHWSTEDGLPPKDVPVCGFNGTCPTNSTSTTPPPSILHTSATFPKEALFALAGVAVLILVLCLGNIYRQYRLERELKSLLWKIEPSELIIFNDPLHPSGHSESAQDIAEATDDYWTNTENRESRETKEATSFTSFGTYRSNPVSVKNLMVKSPDLSRSILLELKQMRDVRHDNLTLFVGACAEPGRFCVVTEYCSRGNLRDILINPEIKLDQIFIASLVSDIVKGMTFLHSSEIKSHGNLKMANCLVDSRWMVKISDYGLPTFRERHRRHVAAHRYSAADLLHLAPEILRNPTAPPNGTPKGDVYSFAIVLQQFHTRDSAYSANFMEPEDIISRVKNLETPPFRPLVVDFISGLEELRSLMRDCWMENPEDRPDLNEIRKRVQKMLTTKGMKTNIFDNVTYMMEKYADNLEDLVQERSAKLLDEQKKTEKLLYQILPRSVAEQLKRGEKVEAETFQQVTIYFSDIVGFTSLSSESTPMQVVTMLNDLYTLCDDIIKEYDVYKVETIGDAYMVVSGLPIRNGHKHAGEICRMALHLVEAVKKEFTVRHKPQHKLMLRVGIHSGSVVAGVVGNTMPRYCLFGDTVNMASRIESNGEALKIHISGQTKDVLEILGGYLIQERGEVHLKGKGLVTTYWLIDTEEESPNHKRRRLHIPRLESTIDFGPSTSMQPMGGLSRNSSLRRSITRPPQSPMLRRLQLVANGIEEEEDRKPLVVVTTAV